MVANEKVLYQQHPAMFRNRPILFIIFCAMSPFLVGLILLGIWWLYCRGTALTITNERVSLRRGILSKYTNDVLIGDIRNVQVGQRFFQRLLGVGSIGVASAGHGGMEIEINGIPDPQRVKGIIDQQRKLQKRS